MKNKAFTLLELLGVVIILGVLSLITFPIILNQIKNAKQGIKDSTKTLIIDAAKDYYEENTNNFDLIEGMTYCIDIKTLTDENYLNKNLKNENLNNIDTNKKVKLIYHNEKFNYEVVDTCTNNSLTRNNIEVPIVTEDSGLYKSTTDKDRFIYRGGDPINNWIELNEGTEETPDYVKYRIVSFEKDGTIKVYRNESIENYEWDVANTRPPETNTFCGNSAKYGCNVWGNQKNTIYQNMTLEEIEQNFYYYYLKDASSPLEKNSNEGTVLSDSSLNNYLNTEWINNIYISKYITEHSFSVGGINYTNGYSGGDKGIKKEKQEEQNYMWKGKIALLNVTEFVEASSNSGCTSVYSNYYYAIDLNGNYIKDNLSNGWPCANDNWSHNNVQWFLTALSSGKSSTWYVGGTAGYLSATESVNTKKPIHPVFYLKQDIKLTGEGSEENPYRIVGEA